MCHYQVFFPSSSIRISLWSSFPLWLIYQPKLPALCAISPEAVQKVQNWEILPNSTVSFGVLGDDYEL
jgi:hypothetical protein